MLQSGTPRISPWPEAVQRAVGALTTGLLEKVALAFPEPWWRAAGDDVTVIGIVGGRWSEWYDITPVTGVPSLVGFCGGAAARSRPASDEACVAEAMAELGSAYGFRVKA